MTPDEHRPWCDPTQCKHEDWVRRNGTTTDGWWHHSMSVVVAGTVAIHLDQFNDEEVFCRIIARGGMRSTFRIDDLLALAQAARQLAAGKNLEPRGLPHPHRPD